MLSCRTAGLQARILWTARILLAHVSAFICAGARETLRQAQGKLRAVRMNMSGPEGPRSGKMMSP
jgi:hypothetical protein